MIVGIVGRGRMGAALAQAYVSRGLSVLTAGRTSTGDGAVETGTGETDVETLVARADVVVLVLPYAAAELLASTGALGPGRGRTLLDVTNPLFGGSPPAGGSRGAQALARALPDWRVVKGLNTVPAGMLQEPLLAGNPVAVPVAGDYPEAKAQVAMLVGLLGFAPVDAGGLAQADGLDALAVLLASISAGNGRPGRIGLHLTFPEPSPPDPGDPGLPDGGQRLLLAPAGTARSAPGRPPSPSR
jgi:8-hydroxy-5-deazaflavin:NADPH oxidoreductase